ncbi:hypothetical protein ACE15N_10500 [Xanthomonas campestris pv. passiflorae]|uniref:hypothetical protein n=1 Tax=Xanthomonas campestris TaxID=339 RepID=UPI0024261CD8|nr:hypothetical protein [Xanthomonas campestris]MBV6812604.1 hypothetical protein [Xanthomonas campestris pv. passiflorae]
MSSPQAAAWMRCAFDGARRHAPMQYQCERENADASPTPRGSGSAQLFSLAINMKPRLEAGGKQTQPQCGAIVLQHQA